MKKRITQTCLILALAAPALGSNEPAADFKAKFPNMAVQSITPTPVEGIYEVVAGDNIIYYAPKTGHLFFGELWTDKGVSLTAEAHQKIKSVKYQLFKDRLGDAVKIGNGKNEVVEVIDPDCPYCRKMSSFWLNRTDVTRYVFFLPLTSLHPRSEEEIAFILSSSDPAKTLADVEAGGYDNSTLPKFARNEGRIRTHADLVAKSGIGGTPAYYINGVFVSGANIGAIEKLLGKE